MGIGCKWELSGGLRYTAPAEHVSSELYCEEDKGMLRGRSVNWENMAGWKGQDSGTREVESSLYDSLGL